MRLLRGVLPLAMAVGICAASAAGEPKRAAAPAPNADSQRIVVLVVTGGHAFAVQPFKRVFSNYADMHCTFVDEKTGGEAYDDIAKWPYQAVVLYNYQKKLSQKQQANFLALMDRGVGLVILHHAIYGYRPWPEFQKIVGVTSWLSHTQEDVSMKIHVADRQHPITAGLQDFPIIDETYLGAGVDPTVRVLLTTDEPLNQKAVAWVHTYRHSSVCYLQLGHGDAAYANQHFIEIFGRAIRWSAGRLP